MTNAGWSKIIGAFATLAYSGHAHFDSDAWMGWVGEMGQQRDPDAYGIARARLATLARPSDEGTLKAKQNYGGDAPSIAARPPPPAGHQHFGPLIVSCEGGDLRPLPTGVEVCDDRERRFVALAPPVVPRAEVIDELCGAVVHGRPPLHDGACALATVEICLAMLRSAREGRDVTLEHQVAFGHGARP